MTLAAEQSTAGVLPTPVTGAPSSILDYDPPMAQFLINMGAINWVERIAFRTCDRQITSG